MTNKNITHKKILHIGWGYTPWRGGGLINYSQDLMEIQKSMGHEISYFYSARQYPLINKPRINKWETDSITMYEIINSPISHHGDRGTLNPHMDLNETNSEIFFRDAIEQSLPNIIHIHELAGLPSSLIEIAKKEYNLPIVMTLADYFLMCPTLKLFDYKKETCRDLDISDKCALCCTNCPTDNTNLVARTIEIDLKTFNSYKILKLIPLFMLKVYLLSKIIINLIHTNNISKRTNLAVQYQLRRTTNIQRLKKIDMLVARSVNAKNTYKYFLGNDIQITTINPTVKHLAKIKQRNYSKIDSPIKFATLNGLASTAKGADLLCKSVKELNKRKLKNRYELHIFGVISQDKFKEIEHYNNIIYHGTYNKNNLNSILDNIDVGIVPSVWEEVFGYVGLEFLAKGIPVIGNNKGGIIEYTKNNITGFINQSSSAYELTQIMESIIINPNKLVKINNYICNNHNKIIKSIENHFYEMEYIYNSFIN